MTPGQVGRVMSGNVSVAVNSTLTAAHKIVTAPIPFGPSGYRKSIELDRAKISTLAGVISTSHPLAEVIEEPTDPHVIEPRSSASDMVAGTAKKRLRFKVKGKVVFAKKVNHPGTKGKRSWKAANRFVERTLERNVGHAIDLALEGKALTRIDMAVITALDSLI